MTTWTPHHYQEKAMQFMVENAEAGLFLSPGLGKTSITLGAFKVLRDQGFITKMLVIAPLRPCYSVWPREVKKWKQFHGLSVGVLHGPKKEKVLAEDHDIYVINPEGLRWLFQQRAKLPEMLVIDESSKFKAVNTQRFKTLKPHLPKFRRRYILTGSPAANSLLDLFGQVFAMDLGKTFGPYITHYRNRFFHQTGFGGYDWALKPGADKEIYDHLAPRVLRMSAEDYLEMPPLIIEDIEVELPPKAMAMYKQLEDALRLDFKVGRVVAANAAVASMKCRQIANGGIYLDGAERAWQHIHDAKTEALVDLIEELEGQPALIAYDFHHDLERIKKAVGKNTPHIGGGVSGKASDAICEQWNRGELRALIGHPQSVGHGLNLQEKGRAVIFFSLPWSFELWDQFMRRIYRQGQKERVFVYQIVAKGTVDAAILKALRKKGDNQNSLFNALKEYWEQK